ncbi:GTP-binding protein Rheb isoform X3 [Balaenoptera ricei]|uniref:GTP-binding protein Rheb isoform X3 n=1 Tax=Balaenoptera ricei TaxID=2746895 RepID=UPI0028BD9456|nr:GTP-binding protein Rheb isoform X3 [Balaenoptera ricei]
MPQSKSRKIAILGYRSVGDTGSSPGLGRSHMPRNNWAREPQLLSLRVWSLCSATREAATVRGPRTAMKSGLRLPQLEKALAQKRRPNTAIRKSSLTIQFVEGQFVDSYDPTIENTFTKLITVNGQEYHLQLVDTAGQDYKIEECRFDLLDSNCQRGHGFEPCSGKIPHSAEQLSPCATTTKPAL